MTTKTVAHVNRFHSFSEVPEVGAVLFAAETKGVGRRFREQLQLELMARPFTTNQSGEPRVYGWLGTSSDIHAEAVGVRVVTSVRELKDGETTAIQTRRATDAEEQALLELHGLGA